MAPPSFIPRFPAVIFLSSFVLSPCSPGRWDLPVAPHLHYRSDLPLVTLALTVFSAQRRAWPVPGPCRVHELNNERLDPTGGPS